MKIILETENDCFYCTYYNKIYSLCHLFSKYLSYDKHDDIIRCKDCLNAEEEYNILFNIKEEEDYPYYGVLKSEGRRIEIRYKFINDDTVEYFIVKDSLNILKKGEKFTNSYIELYLKMYEDINKETENE